VLPLSFFTLTTAETNGIFMSLAATALFFVFWRYQGYFFFSGMMHKKKKLLTKEQQRIWHVLKKKVLFFPNKDLESTEIALTRYLRDCGLQVYRTDDYPEDPDSYLTVHTTFRQINQFRHLEVFLKYKDTSIKQIYSDQFLENVIVKAALGIADLYAKAERQPWPKWIEHRMDRMSL